MKTCLTNAMATIVSIFLAQVAMAADEAAPLVAPESPPISVIGSFGFVSESPDPSTHAKKIEKLRRSASGIACVRNDFCFVAFDEGAEGRMIRLAPDGQIQAIDQPIVLMDGSGEIDAEGAATDGSVLYVIGSHSMKRSDCAENQSSRVLLRAPVDATGKPEKFDSVSLWDTMASTELGPFLGGCLDQNGVDIEGVALSNDRLWFGFRGPKQGDLVPILSLDPEGLFKKDDSKRDPKAKVDWIDIGPERGLRDMAALSDGRLLLLAGPDDGVAHKAAGWTLLTWDPKPRPLATLDLSGIQRRKNLDGCDDDKDVEDRKPEAIYTDDEAKRVLVLSDGLCDGGPMWFDLSNK